MISPLLLRPSYGWRSEEAMVGDNSVYVKNSVGGGGDSGDGGGGCDICGKL